MGKFDEMNMERSGQLRVLLVEADDSTSKIIAALLHKCSYQVTVMPDGLEAWDKLKGIPHDIDLILTEVELPSISGYALLSLIKEHSICKNIPVIMMSPKDSIPTVLKCMLKGAADFLIKPVRKNELKILWQHVWRKRTQDVGNDAQNATTLKNFDVTPVKHVGRSNRSDCPSSLERNNEFNSGANDLQGQAHMLTERASRLSNTRNHQVSVEKLASIETDATANMTNSGVESAFCHDVCTLAFTNPHERHVYAISKAKYTKVVPGSHAEHSSVHDENCEVAETPTATDLIGKFETSPEIYRHSSAINVNESPFTKLELSLRRSYPSFAEDAMGEDVRSLNHSKVSAFSRYDSSEMRHTTSPIFSNNLAVKHEGEIENASYDPVLHSFFSTNPKLCQQEDERSSNPTNSSNYSISGVQNLENGFQPFCDTKNEDFIEDFDTEDDKLETIVAMGDYSETLGSGNLSNCDASEVNDATSANISRATLSESVNDNNVLAHDGSKETSSHLNSQREAALIKFRLKRKDRCYEKKVRYQSRKRLAEKRSRVKGQFIRQV